MFEVDNEDVKDGLYRKKDKKLIFNVKFEYSYSDKEFGELIIFMERKGV